MPSRVEPEIAQCRMERRGVYLLTNPRSASNMFQTMMSKQPGVQSSGYQFFDASFPALMQMEMGPLSSRSEADRERVYSNYRAAWEKVQDDMAMAEEKGLRAFTKEHALILWGPDKLYAAAWDEDKTLPSFLLHSRDGHQSLHTNPTYLPDDHLLALQPVFQIRHPALMFPSMLRTREKAGVPTHPASKMSKAMMTLHPTRELYEWYLHHEDALSPKVIDADDIMNDRGVVRQLCLETGLDPDAVLYEWETHEETDPLKKAFLSTLGASKGILPGLDSKNLNMEKEKAKWIADWGEEHARDLEKVINASMADYEYLLDQRVRAT